jgi:hypothetical protein
MEHPLPVTSHPTSRLVRLLAGLSLVLAFALTLRADPLDRRQLPAGATWFIHLDVDAAKASTFGQSLRDEWLKQPPIADAISKARVATGMDPTREIQSLTLYGLAFSPEQTVVIVRGAVNRPHLQLLLKTLPDYHAEMVGNHQVYSWTEHKPESGDSTCSRSGTFYGTDRIVISPSTAALVTALEVMDGKSPALGEDAQLAGVAPAGTIIQAAVTGLADAKMLPIQSPILRECKSGSVALGEREGTIFLRGRVVTNAAARAAQMKALIQGAQAMAQLNNAQNPTLAALLEPVRATADGNVVAVEWEFSSKELVKMIREAQKPHKNPAPK